MKRQGSVKIKFALWSSFQVLTASGSSSQLAAVETEREPDGHEFQSQLCHLRAVWLGKALHLPGPQFPYKLNGYSSSKALSAYLAHRDTQKLSGWVGARLRKAVICLKAQSQRLGSCVFREVPKDQKEEGSAPGERGPWGTP